ncbi:unnamed protein product [Cuscuta epithymum]|uniref:FHA domain-containing protein n=1 Tax=Cuscuta epithymum TaxID=186058 RepID=A0AAV0C1S6_9ASTE|nr:unnamed protein product [Cuscuta epithymum]
MAKMVEVRRIELGIGKRVLTRMIILGRENKDQEGIVIQMGLQSLGMKDRLLLQTTAPIGVNIDLDHLLLQIGENVARCLGTQTRGDDHRNNDSDSVAKMKEAEEALHAKEKEKPSFELSGKLAAETNRYRGITLLFNEPPDARKPSVRWRLYVLKNGEVFNEPLYVHRQSSYLFGRERRVADIPTDHPSCSKQHAVLQYRQVEKENSDGTLSKQIRPYIMDLGSTNGTFINDNRIEPQRYYELLEKDTIKFGNSSREYVLLHENSA